MPITDLSSIVPASQIDPAMASDAEVSSMIANHEAAADPHTQYLLESEGDARYEYSATRASKSLVGPLSFSTLSWNSFGNIAGFSLGIQGKPSAILVGLNFLFDIRYPWQQAVCAGIIGPVWWQPVITADTGIRVPLEIHNESGFYVSLRVSQGIGDPYSNQGSGDTRYIEIKPESLITIPAGGRVDLVLKKLL